jgi:arylsulfatase A-like enzyme
MLRFLMALLMIALIVAPRAHAESPPNVVLFVMDDLGATDLGCFGSTFYETPNIDRLAASGMRFTAAYSACPVCSPTRASIMTGRYPQRTGITDYINAAGANQPEKWNRNTRLLPAPYASQLALEERTIAEALRDAGYATCSSGKWHLGGDGFLPTDQGFEVNIAGYAAGSPRSYFPPYQNPYLRDGPDGEYLPLRLAEEASQFISVNTDRPFFVYVPLNSVHTPLEALPELIEKYEAKAARMKATGPASRREWDTKVRLVQNHPTYAAMIESMDAAVGIVLEKLSELNLTDNTVVIFTSDNGGLSTAEGRPTSNVPLRAGKGWLYEGGIRVPTIVRWPGVTAPGSTCETPIISNDYFPTLLEVANQSLRPDQEVDGVSLVPLLHGQSIDERPLYWHYPHYGNQGGMPGGAVRVGRWKLIEWYEGFTELYDLEADPSESKNVAKENADIVARLQASLSKWRRDVGAKMPTPNPKYRPGLSRYDVP